MADRKKIDGWELFDDSGEPFLVADVSVTVLPEDLEDSAARPGPIRIHVYPSYVSCSEAAQAALREANERYQAKRATPPSASTPCFCGPDYACPKCWNEKVRSTSTPRGEPTHPPSTNTEKGGP